MNKQDFDRLIRCAFEPSEKEIRLHNLAKYYHEQCEAFDKTICKWDFKLECYMPENHFQLRAINGNARALKEYIFLKNRDIDQKKINKAISNCHHRETPP